MAPPASKPWTVWVIPDLALALTIVTLFYALVLYDAPQRLFRDSDSGWHIRTGERILDRRAVPNRDEYSFSRPAAEWFAWGWAADVAMGAAHRAGGLCGIAGLYLAGIGLCTWLWVRLHWASGSNFLAVCLTAWPMLTTVQLHWLARPHVWGWALLLASLLLLEKRRMRPASAAALSAIWANVHGSFFLFPLLCAVYGTGWRTVVVAGAASLLNPYGWRLHTHLAGYLTDTELLQRVAEFQSFNFHSSGAWQVGAGLLLTMAGCVCAAACGHWRRSAVLLFFCALGLRSARGLPLLALAALPLAGGAISHAVSLWPRRPVWLPKAMEYGKRLEILQQPIHGAAFGLACVVLIVLALAGGKCGFPASEFPVAAAEHLPAQARLLAPDKFGGYLIYRFDGERKVYFDGRSDFYGAAFLMEYVRLIELRRGWEEIVDRYAFTHALLPPRYSLAAALEKAGWKRLYGDDTAVLLERNF